MKMTITVALLLVVFATTAWAEDKEALGGYQPRLDKDGWEILFDGKDFAAWEDGGKEGTWGINADGELYPAKPGPDLATRQRYCDFVIEADFKLGPKAKANSGVFIRVHDRRNDVNTGMEVQILDNGDYDVPCNAGNANGALYDLVRPAVDANKAIGEWNDCRITANDNLITIELNGKEVVKADLNCWSKAGQNPDGAHNKFPYAIGSLPREGFICLQNYNATPVWFKNIRLKPLTDRKPKYTGKEPIDQLLR
ncbi:MAG: DUF1080 domain-containing protein [Planctomycetota bacterium]